MMKISSHGLAAGCVPFAMAFAITVAPASPGLAADSGGTDWCYDAARDLVMRRDAEACAGRVVDAVEAERVRARRRERIRRNLDGVRRATPGGRQAGSGSGFFIARDGALLTNAHVVAGCAAITVEAAAGASGQARLLGTDSVADLALLRADFPPTAIASFSLPRVVPAEEPISVVGYPLHGRVAIKPVLASGHVFAPLRPPRGAAKRFRIRADVRRGNSGGPVLDGHGLVIGVVAAKVNTPRTFQRTGRLIRDIAVAIRSETVFGFLAAHDQPHRRAAAEAPLSDDEIMARARGFVARIVCWK